MKITYIPVAIDEDVDEGVTIDLERYKRFLKEAQVSEQIPQWVCWILSKIYK